ncbi:MAG: hypothetical protein IKE01_03060 [Clostridia bacterium]|nr:hypothetical protein [Clostridia bacterium]
MIIRKANPDKEDFKRIKPLYADTHKQWFYKSRNPDYPNGLTKEEELEFPVDFDFVNACAKAEYEEFSYEDYREILRYHKEELWVFETKKCIAGKKRIFGYIHLRKFPSGEYYICELALQDDRLIYKAYELMVEAFAGRKLKIPGCSTYCKVMWRYLQSKYGP